MCSPFRPVFKFILTAAARTLTMARSKATFKFGPSPSEVMRKTRKRKQLAVMSCQPRVSGLGLNKAKMKPKRATCGQAPRLDLQTLVDRNSQSQTAPASMPPLPLPAFPPTVQANSEVVISDDGHNKVRGFDFLWSESSLIFFCFCLGVY